MAKRRCETCAQWRRVDAIPPDERLDVQRRELEERMRSRAGLGVCMCEKLSDERHGGAVVGFRTGRSWCPLWTRKPKEQRE